jgi:hypothetical protein
VQLVKDSNNDEATKALRADLGNIRFPLRLMGDGELHRLQRSQSEGH